MKRLTAVLTLALWAAATLAAAGTSEEAAHEARMKWWREARFGMFIHWGLYSILGGEWKGFDYGKEMGGASAEWIMLSADIPRDEYAALTKRFNPVHFSARRWVGLAKEAGMKYMIITAKHHDGFALFASKATKFNVVDATPFHRDIIRELSAECRRQGLHFGVYYSHSKDWHHRKKLARDPDPPSAKYQALVKTQIRELLTNYGQMDVIWFDTGDQFRDINTEYGKLVRKLSPNTIISGRLHGNQNFSDYHSEGDRRIPKRRVEGDAETPMTMRDNWGYDRDDNNWKTPRDLIERLSLTVCRGANMLLNVGPRPDGTFSPEEVSRLRAIGKWMRINGEAIYGTQASPFDYDFEWGSMTRKPGKLYLHILRWNPAGISFDGLKTPIVKAYLLADPARHPLRVTQTPAGSVHIALPSPPMADVAVAVLDLDGALRVQPSPTGRYHWFKDTGIRLNEAKIKKQKAEGWRDKRR